MKLNTKNKLYNAATLWLTLSVVFFLVEYATEWMEVVTLGGLVAGSFIEGFIVFLGAKLMRVVAGKAFLLADVQDATVSQWLKAIVTVAAFAWEGALVLSRVMPGYTMHQHVPHIVFLLLVYPMIAILCEKIIFKRSLE